MQHLEAFSSLFPHPVGSAMVQLPDFAFPLYPEEEALVRRAVLKRRIEFSAGRHCARLAMVHIGHPETALSSGYDRAPIWPPGLIGSIAHDADYCAAVVTSTRYFQSIGIDLESIDAVPIELRDQVLRTDEISKLDWLVRPNGADWLTLSFCLKEAAYKAFYPRFRRILDFKEMTLEVDIDNATFSANIFGSQFPGNTAVFQGKYSVIYGKIFASCW